MELSQELLMGKKINKFDENVAQKFEERLERIYNFAISGERIFYTAEEKKCIKSVPSVWQNARIVRYEHVNPYLRLPIIYDLLGFSVMYGIKEKTNSKINEIIEYIFSTSYQEEVKDGYGIGINGEKGFVKSSFYAVGWDVCLSHLKPKQKLLYMILLSPISSAQNTKWYKANKEKYREAIETDDRKFLAEIYSSERKTYWTSGCYLDFGRNKNEKIAKLTEVINSTVIKGTYDD